MFKQRLLSGIVLVLIMIATFYFGGMLAFGVLTIVSLIGCSELLKVYKIEKCSLAVIVYIATILYYLMIFFGITSWSFTFMVALLIVILACYVLTYPRYHADQIMAAFFAMMYVTVMLSYVYQIRLMNNGVEYVVLIFLAAWGCDTCAYCAGRLFGRHKMAPVLSPKKTIEGAVGGLIGAAILGGVYGYFISKSLRLGFNAMVVFPVICFLGGLLSMIGDLAASAIKRNHEIKDYGTLIPGHGGILDRFDSIIIVAPLVYLVITMMTGATL